MNKANKTKMIRRTVDVAMCILLLFLMAYQVTGEVLHEWIGVSMTVLVLTENLLMLFFWVFAGAQIAFLLRRAAQKVVHHNGNATASRYSLCKMSMNDARLWRVSFLCVTSTQENDSLQSKGIHANWSL